MRLLGSAEILIARSVCRIFGCFFNLHLLNVDRWPLFRNSIVFLFKSFLSNFFRFIKVFN